MMKYNGYAGQVTYDSKARVFYGEVIGLNYVITFQGRSVEELEQAFQDSVDEYISWCRESGEKPEKPYSGNLRVRLPQELHARLALEAAQKNVSLNTLIISKLQD